METVFPQSTGYTAMFLVGNRKRPAAPTITERTGTVVVKRTYDIDSASGEIRPSARALPVFVKDVADNRLMNSGFGSPVVDGEGNGIDWIQDSVSIARLFDNPLDETSNAYLRVSGSANGRVVQAVSFDKSVGGRQFTLSVAVAADAPAQISGLRLEAAGHHLCEISGSVAVFPALSVFSASGVWPGNLEATEVDVVLRMATNASRTIFYDNVQLEERNYRTQWDPNTVVRYENDMAAFKPEADLVVLGSATSAGNYDIKVDGATWLSRNLSLAGGRKKAVIGWDATGVNPRKGETGTFPTDPNAYPLDDPLPADFTNHYFNGHRRTRADAANDEIVVANEPFAYFPSSARVTVERNSIETYGMRLRGDSLTARYSYFSGTGHDDEAHWLNIDVPMRADTLVIEPESHRCYVVWRGVWRFDERGEDSYRKLVVAGPE